MWLFHLDLSFNNIEVIDGLDQLTKLKDVTFFNNRISTICNMDSLSELQVLSIGNNKLEELDDVSCNESLLGQFWGKNRKLFFIILFYEEILRFRFWINIYIV